MSELNLYQKIAKIVHDLGVIQKDGAASAAMGGYRFISHGQLLGHLRTELFKHNVVIIPNAAEMVKCEPYLYKNAKGEEKQTIHSIIRFSFDVVDGDDPKISFTAHWYGEGHDNSDKGIQKAGTSAEKYFLMKLFKVSDKDDPDAIKGDVDDSPKTTTSVSASMSGAPADLPDTLPTDVPIPINNSAPASTEVINPDLKKNQLAALIWFGEQLPPAKGWFPGKINALVNVWDSKKKQGKLSSEEQESPSAIAHVFRLIAATHNEVCGEDCPHLTAANLAVVLDGKIVDKG